jgi:hypothetical protein
LTMKFGLNIFQIQWKELGNSRTFSLTYPPPPNILYLH